MARLTALIPPALLLAVFATAAPAAADDFLDRARQAVRDAGKEVGAAAKDAGRSVRDFLADNPSLNRDIIDFGETVGVPGFDTPKPVAGPLVGFSVPEAAPGADLTLTASGLPGNSEVTVAAGPSPGELRRLVQAKTSDRGDLLTTVAVPPAPDGGNTLVFVIETADQRIRLVSPPFKVAAAAAAISVTGTLSREGAECPALRGDDGKLYSLTPKALGAFGPGDRVKVTGTVAEVSTCMQGTTIVVTEISAAK
jgi:hypothetical protein